MNPSEREEFLRERQTGIGASDAPNLVGIGFRSAVDVYRDKTEPIVVRPMAGHLRRGLELEPLVAAMYSEIMGVELTQPPAVSRHALRPWQMAHVDRLRPDGIPVQLKTTAGFGEEWGPNSTDQVPPAYRLQCLHEMGVVGAECEDLIALDVIAWEPRVYRIVFDVAVFNALTNLEADFWRCVQERRPLDAKWLEHAAPVAEQLLLDSEYEVLGPEVETLIKKRLSVGSIRSQAEQHYERLGMEIQRAMKGAALAKCGPWKLKRVRVAAGIVPSFERHGYVRLDIRPLKGKL